MKKLVALLKSILVLSIFSVPLITLFYHNFTLHVPFLIRLGVNYLSFFIFGFHFILASYYYDKTYKMKSDLKICLIVALILSLAFSIFDKLWS